MTKRVFVLSHDLARQRAIDAVGMAPYGYSVTIAEPRRSGAENNLLHALIDEIAKKIEWAGKKRDPEVWKRLLVAAWCRVHGESVEILPALDGHGVDIVPARTSKLTRKECADLIEFVFSWGVEQGIQWEERMAA